MGEGNTWTWERGIRGHGRGEYVDLGEGNMWTWERGICGRGRGEYVDMCDVPCNIFILSLGPEILLSMLSDMFNYCSVTRYFYMTFLTIKLTSLLHE